MPVQENNRQYLKREAYELGAQSFYRFKCDEVTVDEAVACASLKSFPCGVRTMATKSNNVGEFENKNQSYTQLF